MSITDEVSLPSRRSFSTLLGMRKPEAGKRKSDRSRETSDGQPENMFSEAATPPASQLERSREASDEEP